MVYKVMKTKKNFTSAPPSFSSSVIEALQRQPISHRCDEFTIMYKNLTHKIKSIMGLETLPLFFSSSGTAALEASLIGSFSETDRLLCLSNGYYGDQLFNIACRHYHNVTKYSDGFAQPYNLERLSDYLQKGSIDGALLVEGESSNGFHNNVFQLAELIKSQKPDCVVIVDSIATLGNINISVEKAQVDVCISVSGKGLMAPSGVSIVGLGKRYLEERVLNAAKQRGLFSFDFSRAYELAKNGMPIGTPALYSIFGLDASTDYLINQGIDTHYSRLKKTAMRFRSYLDREGLEILSDSSHRLPSITAINIAPSIARVVTHKLRCDGFLISGGIGDRSETTIRIGHMGGCEEIELLKIPRLIRQSISLGQP